MKKPLRYLLFVIYLLIVAALSMEAMLRTEAMSPTFDLFGEKIILDRDVLYRFKGYSSPEINGDGYRDHEFMPRTGGRGLCLFAGDSFTMGLNVPAAHTIPKELELRLANTDVYNMGLHGYGPDQSFLRLLEEGLALNPDRVILGLYPANDFSDLVKNHLFEIGAAGELRRTRSNPVTEHVPALQVHYFLQFLRYRAMIRNSNSSTFNYVFSDNSGSGEAFFELFRILFADTIDLEFLLDPDAPMSRGKYELMSAVLERYRDELEQRGIMFLVVVIPSYNTIVDDSRFRNQNVPADRYFGYEDAAVAICDELGIDCLNLYPQMTAVEPKDVLFNDADQHLTAVGTAFAAEAIREHLDRPAHRR